MRQIKIVEQINTKNLKKWQKSTESLVDRTLQQSIIIVELFVEQVSFKSEVKELKEEMPK